MAHRTIRSTDGVQVASIAPNVVSPTSNNQPVTRAAPVPKLDPAALMGSIGERRRNQRPADAWVERIFSRIRLVASSEPSWSVPNHLSQGASTVP